MVMSTAEIIARKRGITRGDECDRCHGTGVLCYGSTCTWRGGIGGSAMTYDVCNSCWGSGNKFKSWTNVKDMEKELKRLRKLCHKAAKWMRDEAFASPPDVTTGAEIQDELLSV